MQKYVPSAGKIAAAVALSFSGISCTGTLDGDVAGGGSGGTDNKGGSSFGGATGGLPPVESPTYKAIHRLNSSEYNATVADILQTTLAPANGSWLVGETHGFDNIADAQTVDADQYERYFETALKLADDAFANAAFKAKYVTCATPDDACVGSFIDKLGLRILRRPLQANETANFKRAYQAATAQMESHEASLKHVLRSMLASAEFLFRMEFDANPSSNEKHPLTSYELASRLSYFLWSSAPDDALMNAAVDQSVLQETVINSVTERLLADPVRSRRFVENFYGQWLGARRVASHAVAPDVYKAWTPDLANALTEEMYAYFSDFLVKDRSWMQFLTEDVNFVNAPLAQLYGMPAPGGTGTQEVRITTDKRRGFLGLGGFLAQSSLDRRTSPTLRGRWIMTKLLCVEPPAPPEDVPMIEESAGTTDLSKGNVRDILEKHRTKLTCANCHKVFDPYGLPLEQYDGIGAYRTTYGDGSAVDTTTEMLDGTAIANVDEMVDKLIQDPSFKQCVADNMYTYGLGRVVSDKDRPYLDAIQAKWNDGQGELSLRRLIHSIVSAEAFRTRSGVAAP